MTESKGANLRLPIYTVLTLSLLVACTSQNSSIPESIPSTQTQEALMSQHNGSGVANTIEDSAKEESAMLEGTYTCRSAERFRGQAIGTGHCVSLIQHCSRAPLTHFWREGESVKGKNLKPGTIIATFRNGIYPNQTGWHAAIYISQDEQGIWVWDQWKGKPVHRRLIRFKNGRGTPNNDGDAYSVVR